MKRLSLLLPAVLLSGCQLIQDVNLAKQQLQSSDSKAGLITLQSLSEMGYLDARLELARYHSKAIDDESISQTMALYESLLPQLERTGREYARFLWRLSKNQPEYIAIARDKLEQRQQTHGDVTLELLRLYLVIDKSLGMKYAETVAKDPSISSRDLVKALDAVSDPSAFSELVATLCQEEALSQDFTCLKLDTKLFKLSGETSDEMLEQRVVMAYEEELIGETKLSSLLTLMLTPNIGQSKPKLAVNIVNKLESLPPKIHLLLTNYELKQKLYYDNAELIAILTKLHDQGSKDAALSLGKLYSYGKRLPLDPWIAEKYFLAANGLPEADYRLGELYLSGKLGEPQLQRGIEHLIKSARAQYLPAYQTLMAAFSRYPGIQPNNFYAHLFAEVYQRQGGTLTAKEVQYLAKNPVAVTRLPDLNQAVQQELRSSAEQSTLLANQRNYDVEK